MTKQNDIKDRNEAQDEAQDAARMQARGFGLIITFLVVGLLSLGLFALWRQFSKDPNDQAQQNAVVEQTGGGGQDGESQAKTTEEYHVEQLLRELTLEQKVAQLFVVTPESLTGVGTAVSAGETTRIAATNRPVGGVCYFAKNLTDPKQTKEMLRNTKNYIQDACGLVPFMCVDEEGGTVARVSENEAFGVKNPGDMSAVGATGDADQARVIARGMGSYLADLGFNVDFAPVADIDSSGDGTMHDRSFGSTPEAVTPMVLAQIDGFRREGMLCAVKHFPGIGDAEGDSHNERIYSHRTADQMKGYELKPFEAAIKADVPMVMVGHLSCLEIGRGEGDLPASLSPAVVQGLLREDMGYDGLVITDALDMDAVTQVCAPDEVGVKALKAGADLILNPKDFARAYDGVLRAVREGTITEERIDESVRRIALEKFKLMS
ncbi:MAG: glycoside hydrolase family 3 N-terminal domain-containing protein [Coriobacteriales bacterium]|nr:glycoside hydrolase family 3 N-terminal domain-containing protein [Coriobacteriales bacterium]